MLAAHSELLKNHVLGLLNMDELGRRDTICANESESSTLSSSIFKQSGRLMITHDGMTKTLREWSEYTGINRNTLYTRIRRGWSLEDALFRPLHSRGRKNDKELAKIFIEALLAS